MLTRYTEAEIRVRKMSSGLGSARDFRDSNVIRKARSCVVLRATIAVTSSIHVILGRFLGEDERGRWSCY
jgi:hypothetical protein